MAWGQKGTASAKGRTGCPQIIPLCMALCRHTVRASSLGQMGTYSKIGKNLAHAVSHCVCSKCCHGLLDPHPCSFHTMDAALLHGHHPMLWARVFCMACMISGPGGEASVLPWVFNSVLWLLACGQPNFGSMNLDFSLISLY